MRTLTVMVGFLLTLCAHGQTRLVVEGRVIDKESGEPLSLATIGVMGRPDETVSKPDGSFRFTVPAEAINDSLIVRYIGYAPWTVKIGMMSSNQVIGLSEMSTLLDEMVISGWKFNVRDVDRVMRPIRGNLYAMDHEVTNADYNTFLAWLEDHNQAVQLEKYRHDLSSYDKATANFFRRYSAPRAVVAARRDSSGVNHDKYPVVNISWEGAVAYCEWLTEQYNAETKRKRFRKVIFRLPALNEWQIAALGHDGFKSWNIADNEVELIVPEDSLSMLPKKGERRKVNATQILYPWYGSWYYRDKAQNGKDCWLGNFRIDHADRICPPTPPAFDGFSMMSPTSVYFPNNMGLFDVVGNVAEMISEKGKACGGSWNDPPEESTIHSVKNFNGVDKSVGFRVFMEVVEK